MKALVPIILALSCATLAAKKPNFIFILSDDIAQGDMGVVSERIDFNTLLVGVDGLFSFSQLQVGVGHIVGGLGCI